MNSMNSSAIGITRGGGAVCSSRCILLCGSHSIRSAISCIIHMLRQMTESDDLKRTLHATVVKMGLELEAPVTTSLIGFYSSVNEVESAQRLFCSVPTKDLIFWSRMVSAYFQNGYFVEAIRTFREMLFHGVSPNSVSLLSVLPACADIGALEHGRQIHGFAIRREFYSETSLQNSLMDMYAKCGKVEDAISVFHGMKKKDTISWKNMIFACAENGDPTEALGLFCDMRASGVVPDEITIRNVISTCSRVGELFFGLALHCYVIKKGLSGSLSVCTSLLQMYAKFKNIETARRLFDQLPHKDLVAWSAIIAAYSHTGRPELALELFNEMQLAQEAANEFTFVSLLQACSSIEAQAQGRSIHARVTSLGYISSMFVKSALIEFYCKIGRVKQGETVFNTTQKKDLVCWSSMINGYGINGFGVKAVETFRDMLEQGLVPNEVAFLSILSACSHCGLVDEGWKWFNSMKEFGVIPSLAHHTCMVDLLGRQGQVQEALKFLKTIPMVPDTTIWSALLSWCRATYSDVKLAEIAVAQLIQLDPSNLSCYVKLSNMYSDLGMWENADRIRKMTNEKGYQKATGCSMV